MSEASHFDLAVVGGGPAGALLAALTARAGARVLLLEASVQDKRKVCGEYLCPAGVALLRELGFTAPLAHARPVTGMRLLAPSGLGVETHFPGPGAGAALRRDLFDAQLRGLAELHGAALRRGERLETFTREGEHWRLGTDRGEHRARLLVGADGRQSLVAKRLAGSSVPSRKRIALHFYAPSPLLTGELGEMHVLAGGRYVGISPPAEHEWNVSLVCDAEELKREPDPRALLASALSSSAELRARFLPLAPEISVLTTYPITHAVERVHGEGFALVGDAAGFLDPLTGEGIYQALLSARLLAAHALPALTGPELLAPALAAYARDLRRALAPKRRVNRLFQSLIRHPLACELLGRWLRTHHGRADAFIGVVGNQLTPAQGLGRLLFPPASHERKLSA